MELYICMLEKKIFIGWYSIANTCTQSNVFPVDFEKRIRRGLQEHRYRIGFYFLDCSDHSLCAFKAVLSRLLMWTRRISSGEKDGQCAMIC